MKTQFTPEEKEGFRKSYPHAGNRWQRRYLHVRVWNLFNLIQEVISPQSQVIFARYGKEEN